VPRTTAPVALLLAVLAGSAATAQLRSPGKPAQILFRLDGMMQADRQRGVIGFTVVSLGLLGNRQETRFLAVTDARTIGGDPGVLGKDILDAVRPFEPDLLVRGPAALLERLYIAAAGDRVSLQGLVNRATRTYFLREALVIPVEPTTTTTLPTATTLPAP
jgi:hypothetical protein